MTTSEERMKELVAMADTALLDAYTYMVTKPLEVLNDLLKGEHYHAATTVLKKLEESTLDFRVRLEQAIASRQAVPEEPAK